MKGGNIMNKIIKGIDFWLITTDNERERFLEYSKAFRAGFNADKINKAITSSYDYYCIYQNCNCELYCSHYKLPVCHTAIVFYKEQRPIRLLVDLPLTNVQTCVDFALAQRVGPYSLLGIFQKSGVETRTIDLGEKPKISPSQEKLPKISSCNRWDLFLQFIDNMKEDGNPYVYSPKFTLTCKLTTRDEKFQIQHLGAFVNNQNHCITMQKKSPIMP